MLEPSLKSAMLVSLFALAVSACDREGGAAEPEEPKRSEGEPSKKSADASDAFQDAKIKTTRLRTQHLAYEAYPRWHINNQKECPADLSELLKYTNKKEGEDAWGNPLVLVCGDEAPSAAKGFGVLSVGPDGKRGTGDDVRSWEEQP